MKSGQTCASRPVIPAQADPSFLRKQTRHSCESRNPKETVITREKQIKNGSISGSPSFLRKQARHSCESKPVIPAKASPSFLRKQESKKRS